RMVSGKPTMNGQNPPGPSRRAFVRGASSLAAFAALPAAAQDHDLVPAPARGGAKDPRIVRAYQTRVDAAKMARARAVAVQTPNGDEDRYAAHFANYSKALPHDRLGHVDPSAYAALRAALASG